MMAALAVALALTAPLAAPAYAGKSPSAHPRPNVILIQTDDQWDTLIGLKAVRDLIGKQGTTFTNSLVSNPLCCPSRTTVFTGQYSHNHGVVTNHPPTGGYAVYRRSQRNALPVWLQAAGYRTVLVGKYLNGYPVKGPLEIPPGWSRWVAFNGGGGAYYNFSLNNNGHTQKFGSVKSPRNYATDVLRRKLAVELDGALTRRKPMFLNFTPSAPHSEFLPFGSPRNPRVAPRHFGRFSSLTLPAKPSYDEEDVSDKPLFVQNTPPLSEMDQMGLPARYTGGLESLLAVNDAVRLIVGRLKKYGELRNTLLIFTSDNGLMLGEHRLRGKIVLYEESIQVPLVIRGPEFTAGSVRNQLVSNVDLAPTILRATGARAGRVLDGRPLQPFASAPAFRASRDLLIENDTASGLRTPRYVYIEHQTGERELYDLALDPFQLESRHADPPYAAIQAQLAGRLAQIRDCAGRACP